MEFAYNAKIAIQHTVFSAETKSTIIQVTVRGMTFRKMTMSSGVQGATWALRKQMVAMQYGVHSASANSAGIVA